MLLLALPLIVSSLVSPLPDAPADAETSAAAPGSGPAVEAFRARRLSKRALPAANLTFVAGGGSYSFTDGTLREIVAGKDDRPIGYFFEGHGRLTWTVEEGEGAAAKVYADNAKRVGGFSVGKDRSLTAPFTRASFSFSEKGRPALPQPVAGTDDGGPAYEKHQVRFANDRFPLPEIGQAAAQANDSVFFSAMLEGDRDLRHQVDGVIGNEETLAVVAEMEAAPGGFVNWRFARVVGRRPIGRGRHAHPLFDYRLVDVDVDIREMPGGRGTFHVEEMIVPERAVRALGFELISEELVNKGFAEGRTRLSGVTDQKGKRIDHAFAKGKLVLFFPEALVPRAPVRLRFDYDGAFLGRQAGDNYWDLALGAAWYPRPVSDAASAHTFHSVVRSRKPFTAFASGDVVRREVDGEWNLLETKMTRPAPFVMVVAGTYTIQEEVRDGVTCRVASYAVSKEKSGARLTNLFHKFRAYYEPYLGPFPWKEYTIIEMNDFGFGQAPPGMMRITHEAFQSNIYGDAQAELFSAGINERLAHEIAHAYWGGVVWSATREDQWLEEAFAEVSAGRAIEEMKDKADFKRLSNIWRARAGDSKSAAPIALANEMVDKASLMPTHDSFADRTRLLYFKGPTLLLAIRKEVGDEVFFTVLKSFLKSFEKRPAVTTEDFVGLLSYITKKDWKPWFETYFYGFEMP